MPRRRRWVSGFRRSKLNHNLRGEDYLTLVESSHATTVFRNLNANHHLVNAHASEQASESLNLNSSTFMSQPSVHWRIKWPYDLSVRYYIREDLSGYAAIQWVIQRTINGITSFYEKTTWFIGNGCVVKYYEARLSSSTWQFGIIFISIKNWMRHLFEIIVNSKY